MWQHMGDKLVDHETAAGRQGMGAVRPARPLRERVGLARVRRVRRGGARRGTLARETQGARGARRRRRLPRAHAALAALRRVLRADRDVLRGARGRRRYVAALPATQRRLLVALLTVVMIANVVGIGSMLARRGKKTPYDRYAPRGGARGARGAARRDALLDGLGRLSVDVLLQRGKHVPDRPRPDVSPQSLPRRVLGLGRRLAGQACRAPPTSSARASRART